MQPVAETVFMQKPPHQHFRLGILAPYPRHVVAAGFFAVHIGHWAKLVKGAVAEAVGGEHQCINKFLKIIWFCNFV